MRKLLLTTTLALGGALFALPSLTPALADEAKDGSSLCQAGSGEARLPADAIRTTLEQLGYRVDRVKLDHGCFEARAVNDSGYPIEARYHPVTGELVQASPKR
jgi:hypothetical protein